MANFFEDKVNLSFDIIDTYFRQNGIKLEADKSEYDGVIYGKRVHINYDYNRITIIFPDTYDIETFYFYVDGDDRILSHYTISRPKANVLEISNSNIFNTDGKYVCSGAGAAWTADMDKYLEKTGESLEGPFEKPSFDHLKDDDIIGKTVYDIDEKLTNKKGIVQEFISGYTDFVSDKSIELDFMLQYEALLGTRFSRLRRQETNLR